MLYNKGADYYGEAACPGMAMPQPQSFDPNDRDCGCGLGCNCPHKMGGCGCKMNPIVEPPIERCCKREFVHVVPHICPINTKIINHHVYQHTYDPCYTCCEENVITNIDPGCCHQF